ncbi:protein FAR1-RELATED SEQUENCE 5-like [Spinacia oleracea]|uniref:Protein FAR1-RELATED SEQUENCE 5-like n=1 Tax=Spinacia oleracea TaxID=3562 RepID=A0ABM3RJM2_SPIOL|nr:protein FAR1-RELATED SEQUENCE 5-like [Spinacia oleracea]
MENLIRSVIQSTQTIQVPLEPDIQDATMEDVLNNCIENNALAQEREEEEAMEAEEQDIISDSEEPDQDIVGTLMGYTAETVEELLGFYEKHASEVGFSIRKGNTRSKVGTRIVLEKTYVCSAAGVTNNGKNKKKKVQTVVPVVPKKERKPRQVSITRTQCRACLRVKMNSEGRYEVVNHVIMHNHDLTRSQWHYLHRSERQITEEKREAIETMQKSGLSSTASFNYMAIEAGGEENLGHSKKDHLNYCTRLKMKQIEGGDAQAVTDIMYLELEGDPNFFFRFRLDEKGKLRSLFWRDSMMMEDYGIFGDIVIFDTTYRTNRYNLICAPIVGINNHWNNCMFGCAFIGDEKIELFVWLLQTFKKSMGGKSPISIFTDQDAAMNNAINHNAITRFGALKRDPTFKKTFNYCLYKCVTVVEFETNWRSMLQQYELIGEEWFTNVYDLREKWCPALSKDFFSAGILSSQRSESTNHAIGFRANRTTSLTDFYRLFKGTIQRWRSTEKQAEFSCSKSVPSSALPLSGLLKHASEVYTLSLFRDFEEEFGYSIATTAKLIWKQENTEFYAVSIDEEPWSAQRVTYIHESQTVSCTCKNFETSGWLCYHCIRILHLHSVTRIPEQYIKKRWTKSAKSSVWNKLENEKPEEVQYTPWRQTMARKYYNLILKSQSNEETRTLMEDGYAASVSLVDELLASLNVSNTDDASTTETSAPAAPETSATAAPETNATAAYETNSAPVGTHTTTTSDTSVQQATSSEPATNTATEPPMVLDPERCTTKGRNKRPRGPFVKKKKGKTAAPPTADFGTITPNLRLF